MSEFREALRSAFEERGYDVAEVSENRGRVRVAVRGGDARADELREITAGTVGEDAVFGLDVSTESLEGTDAVGTVVSFQHRP